MLGNTLREQMEQSGFKEMRKPKPKKNPFENYGVQKPMNPGNFKGEARERLVACEDRDRELRALIRLAYELFDKKMARRIVRELHVLRDEVCDDEVSTRRIKNLW